MLEMIRCWMWVARVTSSMPLSLCKAFVVASGVLFNESLIQSSSLGKMSFAEGLPRYYQGEDLLVLHLPTLF